MSSIKWIRYSLSLYCRVPVHLVFLVPKLLRAIFPWISLLQEEKTSKKNHLKTYCRRLESKMLRNPASIFDSPVITTLFLKTDQAVEFSEVTPGVTLFAHTQCTVYDHSLIRNVLPTKSRKSFISTNLLEAVISISVNIKDFCMGHLMCSIQSP